MSLRDKMLAVMADVNASVAEREELVELTAIALLTRKNLFILGDPGQAKSYAINAFRSRITGAKQFERLLSKQTDEEQLFGRLDLSSLIPGSVPESAFEGDGVYQNLRFDLQCFLNGLPKMKNEAATFEKLAEIGGKLDTYRKAVAALHPCEPVVQTAGKIPEADIVFLDEIFKCNDGVLNALLTALNERKYGAFLKSIHYNRSQIANARTLHKGNGRAFAVISTVTLQHGLIAEKQYRRKQEHGLLI